MPTQSPRQQYDRFMGLMRDHSCLDRQSPTFEAMLVFLRRFEGDIGEEEIVNLRKEVCRCYNINEAEFFTALASTKNGAPPTLFKSTERQKAASDEKEFDALIPPEGFFRHYIEYTKQSEAPIMYHFFAAVAGLAATMNRRCSHSMGAADPIYPPLGVILLGPSGIKKTTACNIMFDIVKEANLVPTYPEKSTPEALIETLAHGQPIGLIYVPELAVFLGKALYLGDLVSVVTRLMDSPNDLPVATISRGIVTLKDVGVTLLMCSTVDWFVNSTPSTMFGGGFIARSLLVHQQISPRVIPRPPDRDELLRRQCVNDMIDVHSMFGPMTFEPIAGRAYDEFYYENTEVKPEHEMLGPYYQRKPSHTIRLSMLLHAATHGSYLICLDCFTRAVQLLSFMERFLPSLLQGMFRTEAGKNTDKVLRAIQSYEGPIPHSKLVSKMSYCMKANEVSTLVRGLMEAGRVIETHNKVAHTYHMKEQSDE